MQAVLRRAVQGALRAAGLQATLLSFTAAKATRMLVAQYARTVLLPRLQVCTRAGTA